MTLVVLAMPTTASASSDPGVPGRPTYGGVVASARGALTVSWVTPEIDGGEPITGYAVVLLPERRTVVVGAAARLHSFTGLGDDEPHTFEVSAINAVGTGEPLIYFWETRTWSVPNPPSVGTVTANRTTVDVSWYRTTSSSPTDDFVVTAHPSGRTLVVPAPVGTTKATATFTEMDPGVGHSFTVVARNVVGSSTPSAASDTVWLTPTPQAPVLSGEARPNGDVAVWWNKPLGYDRIEVFEVCRHLGNGDVVRCYFTRYGDWTFTDVRAGRNYGYSVRARGELGVGPRSAIVSITSATGTGTGFTPVAPRRVLDTRSGVGAPARTVAPGETVVVKVPGLPAGARSVTLSLTGTGAKDGTFVTAHATGTARPTASHLNVGPGQTVASLATVPVSADGRVSLYSQKRTHLIADLAGYTAPTGGSVLVARPGQRIVDTRSGIGTFAGRLGAGEQVRLNLTDVEGQRPTAAVVNITATGATGTTYLTAYPADLSGPPTASNVNVTAGATVANLAVVRLDANGQAVLRNNSASTHVIVDVVSTYFEDLGTGFLPIEPTRMMDTRTAVGAPGPVGAAPVSLSLKGAVPADARAVLLRVTTVAPSGPGYLMVHPSSTLTPSSTLNFGAGKTVGNATVVPIEPDGVVRFAASPGVETQLLVDVAGYYVR